MEAADMIGGFWFKPETPDFYGAFNKDIRTFEI